MRLQGGPESGPDAEVSSLLALLDRLGVLAVERHKLLAELEATVRAFVEPGGARERARRQRDA